MAFGPTLTTSVGEARRRSTQLLPPSSPWKTPWGRRRLKFAKLQVFRRNSPVELLQSFCGSSVLKEAKKQTNNNKNKTKPGSMCAVAALDVNKDAVAVLLIGKLLVIDHQYRENKQHS